jgi:hypothetical protein
MNRFTRSLCIVGAMLAIRLCPGFAVVRWLSRLRPASSSRLRRSGDSATRRRAAVLRGAARATASDSPSLRPASDSAAGY